ncbi:Hypothetical Protein FCC1311_062082 [Hondaea fermentalgiana]|uniref:Uncharacterized protein n=1 Tax=Hondaea fermentalgiana TaxID=2315210 RepID=A0A2R5GJS7_9STRA|nr:Hypothetical Protein FCC1311_062082 [Hondaea fermentalgiana]|eukprot:GBG29988.1 Hypothetical Protein FCC1311_062082 [Hondaea fermentalgiana]
MGGEVAPTSGPDAQEAQDAWAWSENAVASARENGFAERVFEVRETLEPELAPPRKDFRDGLHVLFFVALLVGGMAFLREVKEDELSAQGFTSVLFVSAGITPAVIFGWSLLLGRGLQRSKDLVRVLVSGILIAAGVAIWTEDEGSLHEEFAMGLVSIGALFFLEKFFFIGADSETELLDTKRRLALALSSPGRGMAMSYFFNFVVPTVSCLAAEPNDPTPVDMEKRRGEFEQYELKSSVLNVLIPRVLDGTDLKGALSAATRSKAVRMGLPKAGPEGHRPMFLYFWDHDETSRSCDLMFDLPTIISSCWDRKRDLEERGEATLAGEGVHQAESFEPTVAGLSNLVSKSLSFLDDKSAIAPPPTVDIVREVRDFSNELFRLCASNPKTVGRVRIISLPSVPVIDDELKATIIQHVSSSAS